MRVVDMTTLGMGPLAAQILGDFGADVIKVEVPAGAAFRHIVPQRSAGMSHTFMQFNRNTRSLALDLKSDLGREAREGLLNTADVGLVPVHNGQSWCRERGLPTGSISVVAVT